jgi:hypothetical protein
VKEVVEAESGIECKKAKTRRFVQADGGKIIIDKVETPYEDNVLLSDRDHFSRIIIADDSPGFTMIGGFDTRKEPLRGCRSRGRVGAGRYSAKERGFVCCTHAALALRIKHIAFSFSE